MAKKKYYGGGMISGDSSAMANLPQQVMIKKYPDSTATMPENLDDGIGGIDKQLGKDTSKRRSGAQPEKY